MITDTVNLDITAATENAAKRGYESIVAAASVLEATGRMTYSAVLSYRGPTVETVDGQEFRYPGTADLRLVRHRDGSYPFSFPSDVKAGRMAAVSIPLAYEGDKPPKVGDILPWEWEDLFNEASEVTGMVAFAGFADKLEVSYLLLKAAKVIP